MVVSAIMRFAAENGDSSTPSISAHKSRTSGAMVSVDCIVDGTVTDQRIWAVWPHANIVSLMILADGNLTIKTNSTSVPDDTLAVLANEPVVYDPAWHPTDPIPAAANVASLYVTNAAATAVSLRIRVLCDSYVPV